MTGLTAEDVRGGLTFAGACRALVREHHGDSRPWASWGDYDRKQFERQCQLEGVRYPFGSRHTNAKAEFARAHGLSGVRG